MTRLCSIEGCRKKHYGHGLCGMHLQRLRKRGTTDAAPPIVGPVQAWLAEHVNYQGDDCLKWPFPVKSHGRGVASVEGRAMSAPRAMCTLAHGEPPTPQHEAAHSCGKGHEGCVSPKHLSWKTTSENRMDMAEHGTLPRGEDVNTAKLTEDQVREIRRMGKSMSSPEIGKLFGVSRYTVWEIQTRRSWAWLD